MKILLRDLRDGPVTVTIEGSEEWLGEIYSWFKVPQGKEAPLLKGSLTVTHAADFVWVEGSFSYRPYLACDLCNRLIQAGLTETVSRSYGLEAPVVEEREKDLKPGELDEFYLSGDGLDLCELLNEVVQLALPTTHRHPDGFDGCRVTSWSDGAFWKSEAGVQKEGAHPFAALKKLKIPAEP